MRSSDRNGLKFDHERRKCQARHAKKRARRLASGLAEATLPDTNRGKQRVHIGGVDIDAYGVRESHACLFQHLLEIIERLAHLGGHIAFMDRRARSEEHTSE